MAPRAEEPLPVAEDHREGPDAQLVDQVVLQQCLDEVTASFVEMPPTALILRPGPHLSTVDADGRPWTRVLHPIWEWDSDTLTGSHVATSPRSPKAGHLATNQLVSLTYWHPSHDTCTADCAATWEDSEARAAAAHGACSRTVLNRWATTPASCRAGSLRRHRISASCASSLTGCGSCPDQ